MSARRYLRSVAAVLLAVGTAASHSVYADETARVALNAVGHDANTLGKTLVEKARTDAPSFTDSKVNFSAGGTDFSIPQGALIPSGTANLKYSKSDFDTARTQFENDRTALLSNSTAQKGALFNESVGGGATIEAQVYYVLKDLAVKNKEDLSQKAYLTRTLQIMGDLENALADYVKCTPSSTLDSEPQVVHYPVLKYCQQVVDTSSSCDVTHNYSADSATGTVTGDVWTPASCVSAGMATSDGFATGTFQCTSMPTLDTGGCTTVNGVKLCPSAFAEPPLAGINPLCKKVRVQSSFDFYKGDTGCWNAFTGYDSAGNPKYERICGGENAGGNLNTCEGYQSDSACTLVSKSCTEGAQGSSGSCYVYDLVYDCGTDVTVNGYNANTSYSCQGIACLGEDCIDVNRTYSTDFIRYAALVSAADYMAGDMTCGLFDANGRPTGNLNDSCKIFDGEVGTCKMAVGGYQDCCSSVPGPGPGEYVAMITEAKRLHSAERTISEATTKQLLGRVAGSGSLEADPIGAELAGQYAYAKGTADTVLQEGSGFLAKPFASAIDTVYGAIDYPSKSVGQFKDWASEQLAVQLKAVLNSILQNCGFGGTASASSEASQAATVVSDRAISNLGDGSISTVGAVEQIYTAYQTAMQVLNYSYKCERSEYETVADRDAGNCHFVGSRCKGNDGECVTKEQVYCCYRSPLARIIVEQLKTNQPAVFGSYNGWGTAEAPDCSGVTLANVDNIDWSAINLNEWIALLAKSGSLKTNASFDIDSLTGSGSSLNWTADRGLISEPPGSNTVRKDTVGRTEDKLKYMPVDELRNKSGQCITLDLGNGVTARSGCDSAEAGALECRHNGTLVNCEDLAYRNSLQDLLGNPLTSDDYWNDGYRCIEGTVNMDCSSLYSQESYWRALEEYARIIGGTTYLHKYVCRDSSHTFTQAICENAMMQNYCGCLPGEFICQDGNKPIACSLLGATFSRCECMDGVCESECTYGGVPKGLEDNPDHVCTDKTCPYGSMETDTLKCDSTICPYG